jgi:hypothetical protein
MNSRRFMSSPFKRRAGNYHTTPSRENAVVHHSKIDRRISRLGHFRQIDPLPTLSACPLRLDRVRTFAPQRIDAVCRFCCKSPKLSGANFPAVKKSDRRPPVDVASITLPRSPASLSSGDEVPHIFTRKSRVQPKEILITSVKRLLQQNLPQGDICSAAKAANGVSASPLLRARLAGMASLGTSTILGSRIVKVEPRPGSLST